MVSKLSPHDMRLYRAVDEVLHYVWDPIGVSRFPEARDEYRPYLPQVFAMVHDQRGELSIAQFLGAISTKRMGLNGNPEADLAVARLLIAWGASIEVFKPSGTH